MELNNHEEIIALSTIESWEKILLESTSPKIIIFQGEENEILSVDYDIVNQDIIHKDCERSRYKERVIFDNFTVLLEKFISFYCKSYYICYKQGLNEIASAFLFLHIYLKLPLKRIFNLFQSFVDIFLNNYYYHPEIYALKISNGIIEQLLKYHDTGIYSLFLKNQIEPNLFATNWLMTSFATKLRLEIVYVLWDRLIKEENPMFLFYLIVGILKHNKQSIISAGQLAILQVINSITINTTQDIDDIFKIAKEIEYHTPKSFELFIDKIGLLDPLSEPNLLKTFHESIKVESMISLPIFPSEVLKIIYPNKINCYDDTCQYYRRISSKKQPNPTQQCTCNKEPKNSNYIIIDLRINDSNEKDNDTKYPILPMSIFYDHNEYQTISSDLINHFIHLKDTYHFIFLTSSSDYFNEFEMQFYLKHKEEIFSLYSTDEYKKQKKAKDDSIQRTVNEYFAKDAINCKKNIKRFREYDTLRTIVEAFAVYQIPYVSYILGGFKEVHSMALEYNVDLMHHEKQSCSICLYNITSNKKETSYIKTLFTYNANDTALGDISTIESINIVKEYYKDTKNHKSFECLITAFNGISRGNKVYLIVDSTEVAIYEIFKYEGRKSFSKKSQNRRVNKFANINHSNIKSYKIDSLRPHLVIMKYDQETLTIDFFSSIASKSFIQTVRSFNSNDSTPP